MAATAWPCWGPCQLQPTLCWWLCCGTISSYGASFLPNYCTSPCTCCWLQESVSSSTPWSKATVPVSHREPKTHILHPLRDSLKSKGRIVSPNSVCEAFRLVHTTISLPSLCNILICSQYVSRCFIKDPFSGLCVFDLQKKKYFENALIMYFWAAYLNISFFQGDHILRTNKSEWCEEAF